MIHFNHKNFIKWVLLFLACVVTPLQAFGDTYPSKPITFIVGYGAGGGADSRSRQVAQYLSKALGQPVIVDNRPGAGGNIGTEAIAKAAPDGYTIGMGNFAPLAVNKALFGNLRFDPQKDIVPIVQIEEGPLVLTISDKSPYKSVKEIIAAAKADPGKLTFASGGIGGSHHLSGALFEQSAGIELIHVPYKSGSAGLTDLISGNVNMMFEQMYSAMPNIKGGKLKAIAITSKKRDPQLPDVPTFTELGYPQVVVLNWQGLIAPKGTPKEIIMKLNQLVNQMLKEPDVKKSLYDQGNTPVGGTPEEFAAYIKAESDKWSNVVRVGNIKP
jgi:tripartite-type tricarboxylate transporter receptor subunit TctC